MGKIVVCGAGIIGLSVAIMLAQDGHQVSVVEADPDGPPTVPAESWALWNRKGVAQFRQPHNVFARFRQICDQEMPGLTERLLAAGCVWVDYLVNLPPLVSDRSAQAGDEELRFVTGRRPVVESVVAAAAEEAPGVSVRRGVRVRQLLAGASAIPGTPHVSGVVTEAGEQLRADLVIDAMGRRTPAMEWLAQLGAQQPQIESEDRGFVYYSGISPGPTGPADEHLRCARSAAFPYSSSRAITTRGRSRCSGSPAMLRSKRYATRTVSPGLCRPARCMRTGSTARRSRACCPWRGFSTATTGSQLTVNQSCPATLPSAMRGLAPIRQRAGGFRSGWSTPNCCAVSCAPTSTIPLNSLRSGTSTPANTSLPITGIRLLPTVLGSRRSLRCGTGGHHRNVTR